MQLLISDANILIDLEEGELLAQLFTLPYQFTVPDILYFDELEAQHGHLMGLGLKLAELNAATMLYAVELVGRVRGLVVMIASPWRWPGRRNARCCPVMRRCAKRRCWRTLR